MNYEIVPLHPAHLVKLLETAPQSILTEELEKAYFSRGSAAMCLLADGVPVFAGGIVNLYWHRGEGWLLPTPFFRSHIKVCLRELRDYIPQMAVEGEFVRVQATCFHGISATILKHLGFSYEGTMLKFGPAGETCDMYSRIFEAKP